MNRTVEILLYFGSLLSRTVNALFFGGSMHQTLSARAHVEARNDPAWERLERRIDWLARRWESRHCALAWAEEVARARRVIERDERTREPDFMLF